MRRRNLAAASLALAVGLAGCAGSEIDGLAPGGVFKGAVVTDEPLAARAGMEMLAQGGSAADAAVAAYFTLAVTYPSAASLGGGGVCLVADWDSGEVQALDFVAPRSSAGGSRPTAVPANTRGMAALHARYGHLDWRMLLAPAERTARMGEPLTRASANAYRAGGQVLQIQPEARSVFAPRGVLPAEGHSLPQTDLADVLTELRLNGAAAMYKGPLAERMVAAVQRAGGTLVLQDLRNFTPSWHPVDGMRYGNDMVYAAPPPAGAGLVAGQIWQMLAAGKRYARADEGERLHLLAETSRIAFAGRERWLADDGTRLQWPDLLSEPVAEASMADYDPKAAGAAGRADNGPPPANRAPEGASVVVLDYLGSAVACSFTAYRPFGNGMVAPGTGVLLAPSPGPSDRNPLSLGPVIVYNPKVRATKFVGAGGPWADGATALARMAAATVIAGQRLDREIWRPRVHHAGGDRVYLESEADAEALAALTERGYSVARVPSLGQVNAIHCPPGYPVEPDDVLCLAASDPRGYGLAAFPD